MRAASPALIALAPLPSLAAAATLPDVRGLQLQSVRGAVRVCFLAPLFEPLALSFPDVAACNGFLDAGVERHDTPERSQGDVNVKGTVIMSESNLGNARGPARSCRYILAGCALAFRSASRA